MIFARSRATLLTTLLVLLSASAGEGQVVRARRVVGGGAFGAPVAVPSSPWLLDHQPPLYVLAHQGTVRGVAFSTDGKFLATASADQLARVWGANSGVELRRLEANRGAFFAVAFCPDKRVIALGTSAGTVRLWDCGTRKELKRLDIAQSAIQQVAFSADGSFLACGGEEGTITLWDWSTGRGRGSFGSHRGGVTGLALAPDGHTLASAGQDGIIHLWSLPDGQERRQLVGHQGAVEALGFAPDSASLVSGGVDQTVRFWDAGSGEELRRLQRPQGRIRALAFSPDGRTLATAGGDRIIRLWEVATGEECMELRGHTGEIDAVQFSPGGRLLASGAQDQTARIWDVSGLPPRTRMATLSEEEIAKRWAELGSPDAAHAYRAMWILADAGAAVLPFIRSHLPRMEPSGQVDARHLATLVAELDDNHFATREKATEELEKAGKTAEPVLRQALSGRHSAEVLLRVSCLLENLKAPLLTRERLRLLRTLELLEHIGTPEARRLVEEVAQGPGDARLTREAKASLDRLSRPQVTR